MTAALIVTAFALQATQEDVEPLAGMTDRINGYRASQGLPELAVDRRLNQSAQAKADEMAREGYWDHNAPDGTEPWHFFTEAGYAYDKAGENLSRCFDDGFDVVQAWIKSPVHEEVLTGDYRQVGYRVAEDDEGCALVVAHFGRL
ncbi:CAP domain-containing protein [Tsukamurella spumae]|uniref:SCP domain-containing protein n=1 Tax=Tsukamurella spumae TaxID=44753 RepID=A0A846X066_9ACTN|nr:CAP domain-containing protein [Tsukamurella spumae]NKY18878.1 hypothetical protein [Tsukamurella spumae]